jgi:hypothetical protein
MREEELRYRAVASQRAFVWPLREYQAALQKHNLRGQISSVYQG